ncbi:hypothetical protein I3843_07G032400 [Carya illinoinensis]|nr:hypothetical protein I3843_07G032400 [Carya illinoinensis]
MFKPSTLIVAFGLAQLQEEEVTRKQYPYQNTQTQNNPYSPSLKSTPLRLLGQNSIPRLPAPNPVLRLPTSQNPRLNPPFQQRNHYPIKCVSPKQMQERRDKELCYFCDEKEWNLKGEKEEEFKEEKTLNQLNTMALPTTQQAELLGISLHAIARASSPKTLRLVGKIGTCLVIVLIDIGSTHSFIDVNVVRRAKLPVGEGHLAIQNLFLQGLRLPKKAIKEEHNLSKAALIEGRGIWLQFMEISYKPGGAPIELALQAILSDFKTMFTEPRGLSPPRSHDH